MIKGYRTPYDLEGIRLDFKETIISTITSLIQSYYKLVQDYNNLEIDELSLKEAFKLLQTTQARIKAGKLAATEIVQQQAQITNQQLALSNDRNTICQDYRDLLIRLGLDPRSNLEIDRKIQTKKLQLPTTAEAIQIALANNPEYQKYLVRLNLLERALLVAKNEQQWKLNLIGRAQQKLIRRKDFTPVNIDQIDTIGNELPGNNRSLILNLNIPIHDVNRRQNLVRAKIALQQYRIALQTQRQKMIAAVMNAVQNLQTQNLQLKIAKDAVQYSDQSLYIAHKKFEYGRTTIFEVTTLQRNLTLQQLAFISAQIAYLNSEADFEKLLGISLDKWSIKLAC